MAGKHGDWHALSVIHCSHLLPQTNEWKMSSRSFSSSASPAYLLSSLIVVGSILLWHTFNQYTKQGPSARRKRLDCWDEDYAVHRSCKKNVKRTSWRRAYNMEAEIQIFDRLRDLKGVMNGKWRTYSAKHSTINIMLSHILLILQGVSNMPGAWPMVFAVTIG